MRNERIAQALIDGFVARILKKTDAYVALVLAEGPRSTKAIAARLHISTRTVQRSLRRLAEAKLVQKRTHNGDPLDDEWEIATAGVTELTSTKLTSDPDRSLAKTKAKSYKAEIDRLNVKAVTALTTLHQIDELARKIADRLCLESEFNIIKHALTVCHALPLATIMRVVKRVGEYLYRQDGSPNPTIRQPGAYFAKSLFNEYKRVSYYYRYLKDHDEPKEHPLAVSASNQAQEEQSDQALWLAAAAYMDKLETQERHREHRRTTQERMVAVRAPSGKMILVGESEAARYRCLSVQSYETRAPETKDLEAERKAKAAHLASLRQILLGGRVIPRCSFSPANTAVGS